MDVSEYLHQIREKYVSRYREVLRENREQFGECTAEVWVTPNVLPGEVGPPHPLCVDIIYQVDGKSQMVLLAGEEVAGGLIGIVSVGNVAVKVFEAVWEAFPVWICHGDPDWAALEPWQ